VHDACRLLVIDGSGDHDKGEHQAMCELRGGPLRPTGAGGLGKTPADQPGRNPQSGMQTESQ